MTLSRKDQEQQTRRAAILFAARRLFTEKGFAGTTVAEIARRAEVSVGAIYQLFESKEALQSVLLEEKASRLLAHAGGGPAPGRSPPPARASWRGWSCCSPPRAPIYGSARP